MEWFLKPSIFASLEKQESMNLSLIEFNIDIIKRDGNGKGSKTMTKQDYLNLLQKQIDELDAYYEEIPENELIERAITLGKINSFLIAKLQALEIEETK